MRGGEGYDTFLKNVKKQLFKSRFDRSSPEKKKGITYSEAKHLLKIFLLKQSEGKLTKRRAEKLADAEVERIKKIIHRLEKSPTHKYLPILRKKRLSPRRTVKRQRSLTSRKPRHYDEKKYYQTRLRTQKYKTQKSPRRHIISPSEKWGTV